MNDIHFYERSQRNHLSIHKKLLHFYPIHLGNLIWHLNKLLRVIFFPKTIYTIVFYNNNLHLVHKSNVYININIKISYYKLRYVHIFHWIFWGCYTKLTPQNLRLALACQINSPYQCNYVKALSWLSRLQVRSYEAPVLRPSERPILCRVGCIYQFWNWCYEGVIMWIKKVDLRNSCRSGV